MSASPFASTSLALRRDSTPGAPDWIHLIPAGTFQGRDGRGPYRLANARDVMEQTRLRAGACKMPVDYEHQGMLAPRNGKPAPAAGWIDALQARANGIWGRVTWTDAAARFIANREYRYLSPVFNCARDGAVTRLLSAALTNEPNLDQLTALARAETPMGHQPVHREQGRVRCLHRAHARRLQRHR